jgi:hypothetical protein
MSSRVETSLDFDSCLKIRDSSTSLGMTLMAKWLSGNRSAVAEKFLVFNDVHHFLWNHSFPAAVSGLQFGQDIVRMNSQILRMIVGNFLHVLIVD